jgi:hypothetical protein
MQDYAIWANYVDKTHKVRAFLLHITLSECVPSKLVVLP